MQLLLRNKRILVTAPSNIAVDNVADKLLQIVDNNGELKQVVRMCRLGHPARFIEKIQTISLETLVEGSSMNKTIKQSRRELEKTAKQLGRSKTKEEANESKSKISLLRKEIKSFQKEIHNEVLKESNIVLGTNVGAGDKKLIKFLGENKFDVVIIDECAQATEASCYIPLFKGRKLVLAGDHLQLPPTIKSEQAAKDGLEVTLFDRMIRANEPNSRLLNTQYRMNKLISQFSSDKLYGGKLVPADSVADRLMVDLREDGSSLNIMSCPLVYIDTSNAQLYEEVDEESGSKLNRGEAKVVFKLIEQLGEIPVDEIGVIAPYSAQVNILREQRTNDKMEISTVDGFQGREKEIIILTLTRSNNYGEVGFLAERRRLNVAVTRAKRMLVVIGDFNTVANDPFMKQFVEYIEANGRAVDLFDIYQNDEVREMQTVPPLKDVEKDKTVKKNKKQKKKVEKPEVKEIKVVDEIKEVEKTAVKEQAVEEINVEKIEKIKKEIELFLSNDKLPVKIISSLNSQERKEIHSFCEAFSITHESQV